MTRLLAFLGAAAVLLAPLAARADAANDPCMDLKAGDDCTTLDHKAGTCTEVMGFLDCVEGGGGAGGGGAGGQGAGGQGAGTGGGATTGGGQSPGTGGSDTTGGGETDTGGCAMSRGPDGGAPALAGLAAIALGAFLSRRRRDRSRA